MRFTIIIIVAMAMITLATVIARSDNTQKTVPANEKSGNNSVTDKGKENGPVMNILFFQNPSGRPCQIQQAVLDGMHDKLTGLARITPVSTQNPADRNTFYTYGIRSLPSLLILDAGGKEVKRFSPGIQDEEAILAALESTHKQETVQQ